MTTLIPALLQVIGELAHFRRWAVRRLAFGKLTTPQPPSHGLLPDAEGPTDGRLRVAAVEQGNDLLVTFQASLSAQLSWRYLGRHRWRTVLSELCGIRLWCLRCRFFGGRHNQLSAMRFQHPFHGGREVDEEMEAIGYLLRLWCPARRPFSIKPATIP